MKNRVLSWFSHNYYFVCRVLSWFSHYQFKKTKQGTDQNKVQNIVTKD